MNVVFSGHEHLYEHVAPQHGIAYFVSGGGGRSLYDVRPSEFDEVAISEHHFNGRGDRGPILPATRTPR